MEQKKIPVTILTGFLGAGKTTLLNNIIAKNKDTRFAIIENEFGDINIDNELVVGADEGIFEMSNGCICCTLNDDLVKILIKLLDSRHDFQHLIIETTGMAEPDGVAAAFVADPSIQQVFRLDSTVCLVDVNHIEDLLEERKETMKQITFADHIILNKKSSVTTSYIETLNKKLKQLNPFASIETADYGKVETNILKLEAYEAKVVEEKLKHTHEEIEAEEHTCTSKCTHTHHDHSHDHKNNHSGVESHSFVFEKPLDFLKFKHWITVLLMIQGKDIYRIKGILNFEIQEERLIFQSVRNMHVFQKGEIWKENETRQTRLVFIGKDIQKPMLEKALMRCTI